MGFFDTRMGKSEGKMGQNFLGEIFLTASDIGLCSLSWGQARVETLAKLSASQQKHLATASKWLEAYFTAQPSAPEEILFDFGSASQFQLRVWQELSKIPFGQTCSYQVIAEKIGRTKSARAVGQAIGKNPLPIFIPCHRVISADGGLGGFSAGLVRKKKLLAHEGIFL